MVSLIPKNKEDGQKGNLLFVKEVAKYFMDFLETDFHKRKNPRRSIKLRNNDNLLVGINLAKYPSFTKQVWALVNHSFDEEKLKSISKGVHRTNLPQNLLDLIKLQVTKIQTSKINEIVDAISIEIEKASVLHQKEYDKALSVSLDSTSSVLRQELIEPFISGIEKPIENLEIGDENDVYLMQEELTEILLRLLENKISEILKGLLAETKVNISKQIKSVFDIEEVKASISSFFESFQVGDLFSELFEADRNKAILDKQDFYLYFCDITFNKVKYPLFYTPFTVKREKDTFGIEFDSQIYINKKALEYIVQEYNVQKGTKGNLKTVTDRIIYISQHKHDLNEVLATILSEIEHLFELDKSIDLNDSQIQSAKSQFVRISNSAYIALFDKSDESLVNDYEAILQELNSEEGNLADIFNILIDDFIHKNPDPINPEVESEWDNSNIPDKLVSASPIPLNSEQLQILSAIRKDKCKYLIVEGPPGTGKSHTITAIIFDAILRHQSILVLSDKKEALDVVEDKITETMNKVRYDEGDFQNPILRLGKTGSTYSQILARPTLEKIKAHHRAVKKDYNALEEGITKLQNSLKEDVEAEILSYSEVDLKDIHNFYDLESYYDKNPFHFDLDELSRNQYETVFLGELREFLIELPMVFKDNHILEALNIKLDKIHSPVDFLNELSTVVLINETLKDILRKYPGSISSLNKFKVFSSSALSDLKKLYQKYLEAKRPLVGYLFSKSKLEELNADFRTTFPFAEFSRPNEHLDDIKGVIEISEYLNAIKKQSDHLSKLEGDFLDVCVKLFLNIDLLDEFCLHIDSIRKNVSHANEGFQLYPKSLKKLGIEENDLSSWLDNKLISMTDLEFEKSIQYVGLKTSIESRFNQIPQLNYASQKKEIETLVTTKVTHLLDTRLINFYTNNQNDAETLRTIIKDKKKFPKEQFSKLKEAFPCILAGIRDYAEYIPLESGIFDLVIIDEASQVSIAQAFPALIRAKKVLILGDKKQFSNVKAAQARSETNREYLNALAGVFRSEVSNEDSKLVKLSKFDIKTSILEFFEFISNYNTQLLKHFRGYKEIISYSNKYFYQDSLQVMKIRGKAIDEVIKFSFVESDGKAEVIQNTNRKEIEKIITELQAIREADKNLTVGIITPHTNQQKLLIDEISKLPERDYYFDKLKLKIMTFDTCQGEERDIIFYSMVATEESDRLWGVFITDFNSIDNEEEGRIKVQRLNVGLSRAKECIHFVVSKPLDKFNGSIGDALRHYHHTLEEAKKEKSVDEVDQSSKMEPEVLNWFYQTSFWKKNKDNIEFQPQFEIGKYLKQLDRTYQHPNYKVDFLLVYKDENHKEHKIIIEYDGFKEHFTNVDEVNEFNYTNYYSEGDVYRQKVLESYGYKFLRINRFNIGANPIDTLDQRISSLLKNSNVSNRFLDGVYETIEGIQNGQKKECPKCKELRDSDDFKDASLITGYGKFCKYCKGKTVRTYTPKPAPALTNEICPRCGSKMVLRNGRKGKFYGCSRFPYCRGTKNI